MHPDDQKQLSFLVATQERLRREMELLDAAIRAWGERLEQGKSAEDPLKPVIQTSISELLPKVDANPPVAPNANLSVPPPLPVFAPDPFSPGATLLTPHPEVLPRTTGQAKAAESRSNPASNHPEARPRTRNTDSLELQLGTVWLVRIGVVVLLTGLVFLGNYAYQNFIGKLEAGGRLMLLYGAGVALCAAGAWIERGKEALRNYSRVLMGAGVATLYYATYAAYFVRRLKVIESPITAGVILLVLSAGIVWLADRKRSETLAVFAVLLSFYTGTMNPIAEFTLFSDLLLTAVAVLFLVRHRWTTLAFLSLAGAYIGFGFWRYFHTGIYPWMPRPDPQFWSGTLILTCYWVLFTAGLFLCEKFPPNRRVAFLSLNNGAYFALATVLIRGSYPAAYWMFPCGLGAVFIALAWAAQRRMRDELLADGAYLAQGIALVSMGLAAKLSGYQLAITLGLEGAVLLTCCRQRHGWIYRAGAVLVSLVAFGIGEYRVMDRPSLALPVAGLLALLFLYDARWSKRLAQEGVDDEAQLKVSPIAGFFVGMALMLGLQIIRNEISSDAQLPVLAAITVIFAYALPLHGLIELAYLGQLYLLGADLSWLTDQHLGRPPLPWWNPALLVAATLAIVHWWQALQARKAHIKNSASPSSPILILRPGMIGQVTGALVLVAVLQVWFGQSLSRDSLLLVLPVLGIVLLGYGAVTRATCISVAGQFFVAFAAIQYFEAVFAGIHPVGMIALLAVAGVVANGIAVGALFKNAIGLGGGPALEPGGFPVVEGYHFLALGMYVAWGFAYVPEPWRFAFFTFSALALFGSGAWSKIPCRIRRSGLLFLVALGSFWAGGGSQVSWLNLIAILALLVTYHASKRCARNGRGLAVEWEARIAYPVLATLWLLVTRWVRMEGHGFYTTVAWSVLAALVLGSGFALRDQCHRRAGLALLGLALGRILLIDIWQLEMGYRIASLLVLGIVLPLLGFFYNRFADRIRNFENETHLP